jgi:hypothetical protein
MIIILFIMFLCKVVQDRRRMMNIHIFLDRLMVGMSAVYGDKLRFFRESLESGHISDYVKRTEIDVPYPENEGEVKLSGYCGDIPIYPAYKVLQWHGPESPAIIFTHGSGDFPYYKRLQKIFPKKNRPAELNLIATNIPFNSKNKMEYIKAVGNLENFTMLLSATAVLVEELVCRLRSGGSSCISISGISLGGWITNIHKTYFDSADEYRPIFAGAAPEHLFTDSIYRNMASSKVNDEPEAIEKAINFEDDFAKRDNKNVYPLMARFDQYIVFAHQSKIYREKNITTIDYGHVSGTMQRKILAEHINSPA